MRDARRRRPSLWIAAAVVVSLSVAGQARQFPSPPPPPSAQSAPASGLILGRVVDAATNRPMAGAVVRITGSGPRAGEPAAATTPTGAMTNAQGEFLFRDLEPGAYDLAAQASGYMPGSYGLRRPGGTSVALSLEAGARVTDATIRMWRYASITGAVLDEAGDPVVNTSVRLLRRATLGGRRQLLPILPMNARTDDRGVYRFGSITPGDYAIVVPSSTLTAPRAETREAERTRALAQIGLISPALGSGIPVGDWQLFPGRSSLDEGGAATPDPGPDGRILVYPMVFHPATVRPSEAAIVSVDAGEERTGVDVRLPLVPALQITGTITSPIPVTPALRLQLATADPGLALASGYETASAVPAADGRFAFLGVPAGQYVLKAIQVPPPVVAARPNTQSSLVQVGNTFMSVTAGAAPPPLPSSEPTLWAEMPVTLSDEHVDNVQVALRTGARISGRLEFDGTAERPSPDVVQRIYFGIMTPSGMPSLLPLGRADAQGQFTTAELPPGRYMFRMYAAGVGPDWTLESILVNGRNAADVPFELGGEHIRDVVIRYTTQTTTLAGSVRQTVSARPGDPNAVVVLFPADQAARLASGGQDRTQIVDLTPTGTFQVTGLPAGEYVVTAVNASALPLDLLDPDTVAALTRLGTRVTLDRGGSRSLSLTVSDIR